MLAEGEYLNGLNDVQRQAVTTTEGPVLVVAGPGSGKTRVLTYRIAHLIRQGVKPWEILSLTFTNKAAREMKERIEQVVGVQAQKVWAGTFHSIFARILRVEAEKIGYPSNFTIYDTDDTKSLLNAIIREMNLDPNVYNVNVIRSRISSAKSNLITPKLYSQREDLREQDRLAQRPFLHAIYSQYSARCKRSGAMDFDDLLYRLYELFQTDPDDALAKYRARFRYILVDEFQDTNHLQYSIIRKLGHYEQSPRNICVVGDDAQSIYSFRGATIQNILDFENDFQHFGIKVFKLEQNYRSTEHIVQDANEVIANNRKQIQKKIWSDKGDGHRIKVIKAVTDVEEGNRISDTILEYKNRYHLQNKDIAILYRTNAQSRVFEEHLRRYNIPYRIFGGLSFYQRKEVKDLIGYLRLAVNPNDDEALRRVINLPKRGIGNSTVEKIAALSAARNQPMWNCLTDVQAGARAQNALAGFADLIRKLAQKAKSQNAYEVASYALDASGLLTMFKSDTSIEGMGRLENVNALLDGIKSFVEEDEAEGLGGVADKSLASYLQNIALLTDFDTNTTDGDFVTLMSVHSAKGLEFKAVFLVGMEEKLFPSFMSMDTPEGLDEERRLFYVAITRAEQLLTLSYAKSRYQYGQMRYNQPSRFLDEIPRHHLESNAALSAASGSAFGRSNAASPQDVTPSGVKGYFKKEVQASSRIAPEDFKPSPPDQIQPGMKVLHLKFGKGKVISVDGQPGNRIASIHFPEIDNPDRRIVLKYAKLQIVD